MPYDFSKQQQDAEDRAESAAETDLHPLDEPLGAIHQASWQLQYLSVRISDGRISESLGNIAAALATAHEQIQQYAIQQIDSDGR